MATRFRVARQSVRYNKQTYRKGEFLPESFTERDIYKVLYPSRLEEVEVATGGIVSPAVTSTAMTSQSVISGVSNAEKTLAAPTKTTGASLSGNTVIKK